MDKSYFGQLHVFQTIAKEGNISSAARKLGIAVPSVSQSLKTLEQKVGVPLFQRTTRQIQLTEAGAMLLKNTLTSMQTLQQAIEEVQQFGSSPSGMVRITLSRYAYQLILKPIFAEFCQIYPQIQLEISVYDGITNLVDEGFDLGIRFGNTVEEGMVARLLLEPFREGLYASASYIEQNGYPTSPADLTKHKLIGYRFVTANRLYPLTLLENGHELQVEMPIQLTANDIDTMNDAIRYGIGIGRIFEPILNIQPDKHLFIPILEPYWKTHPAVYLYYLKHSQKARRVQVLIDFIINKTRQIPI